MPTPMISLSELSDESIQMRLDDLGNLLKSTDSAEAKLPLYKAILVLAWEQARREIAKKEKKGQ